MKQHIIEVTPSKLPALLKKGMRTGRPIMMHGSPGTVKSSSVKQLADELGMDLLDMRLSQREFVDLRGGLEVREGLTYFCPPGELPQEGCKPTIIFLDEINQADQSTQAAAYQLFLDGQLGEYILPDNCWIVAAGNYLTDRAIVNRMGTALNNRVMHLYIHMDSQEWSHWALVNKIHTAVIGFIRFAPECLAEMQSPNEDVQNRLRNADAFATSRTIEYLSDLMNDGEDVDNWWPLACGTVGIPVATKFRAYVKYYQELPDFDTIIAHPKTTPIPSSRQATLAVSIGLAARVTEDDFGAIMEYMSKAPVEYSTALINDALRINDDILDYPEIAIWLQQNAEILG
jgi:MoxR-like ATPase